MMDILMLLIMMMMMDDSADGDDEEVPLGGSLNQTWSPPSHQSSPGGSHYLAREALT